jgi:hypothetical protein
MWVILREEYASVGGILDSDGAACLGKLPRVRWDGANGFSLQPSNSKHGFGNSAGARSRSCGTR